MTTTVPGTLSLTEAGVALGMSRAEVYRRSPTGWLVPGHVPVLDMGPRLKRVPRAAVETYITTGGQVVSA